MGRLDHVAGKFYEFTGLMVSSMDVDSVVATSLGNLFEQFDCEPEVKEKIEADFNYQIRMIISAFKIRMDSSFRINLNWLDSEVENMAEGIAEKYCDELREKNNDSNGAEEATDN